MSSHLGKGVNTYGDFSYLKRVTSSFANDKRHKKTGLYQSSFTARWMSAIITSTNGKICFYDEAVDHTIRLPECADYFYFSAALPMPDLLLAGSLFQYNLATGYRIEMHFREVAMLKLRYQLNDRMNFKHLMLYGIQWWVIAMPMVVILGVVSGSLHETTFAGQSWYLQKMFIIVGLTMLVQVLAGHRLPLITGPASILFVGLVTSQSSSINSVYTAMAFGGLCLALVAATGLLKKIQWLFTPRVVSVILILIATSLAPVILNMVLGDGRDAMFHTLFAMGTVFFLLIANNLLPGVWKATTVIWGTLGGSILYIVLSGTAPTALGETAPSLSSELSGMGVFLHGLEWETGPVLAFIICFVALLVNSLGSMESVGHMLHVKDMDARVTKGVAVSGACNMLCGATGVLGNVDFSFSSGIIAATGCASRFPLVPASIGLMLCAFFPGLIRLFLSIPTPVLGAIILYFMSSQLATGLNMLVQDRAISSFNSGVICGLPIMVAIIVSFTPPHIVDQFPQVLKPLVGNGFVVSAMLVLVLEHVIFREKSKQSA